MFVSGHIILDRAAKILVTGATGLLGHSLIPQFRSCGYPVTAQGFANASDADVCADMTDLKAAAALLDEVNPDIVINLVSCTDVDLCEAEPQTAFRLNVRSVMAIARWMKTRRHCHLFHISTDQVYEGRGPHREDDVNVINVYGLSKYAGELIAVSAGATVLRTNFFGPSGLAKRPSFSDWILDRLRRGEDFTAFDDVAFSPLSMETLGKALNHAIMTPVPGVFNLGSREGCSKADFAFTIARHFKFDPSPIHRGSQSEAKLAARRPCDMRMDSTMFEKVFDFALPTTKQEIYGLEVKNEPA